MLREMLLKYKILYNVENVTLICLVFNANFTVSINIYRPSYNPIYVPYYKYLDNYWPLNAFIYLLYIIMHVNQMKSHYLMTQCNTLISNQDRTNVYGIK